MQKQLSTLLLLLAFVCLAIRNEAAVNPVQNNNAQSSGTSVHQVNMPEGTPIIAMDIVMARATLNWDFFGDPGPYAVTVTDLTAFNTIASFTTSNTSAIISGLTNGHTYRFEVVKGYDAVILELVTFG